MRLAPRIGALVVMTAGLATACSPGNNSTTTASPLAQLPSPVVWLEDGHTPTGVPPRYLLTDWTGHQVGSLSMYGTVQPSPDGSRALLDQATIIDARGSRLAAIQVPGVQLYGVEWADDSRHLCGIAQPASVGPDAGQGSLWLLSPGGSPRRIANVGQAGSDPGIAVCSIKANRVVIVSTSHVHIPPPQGDPYDITVLLQIVDLGSGATIYAHDYGSDVPAIALSAGVSPDAGYLAEYAVLTRTTTIKDLSTGHRVATFANASVTGFSWDNRSVALHTVAGNVDETRVVDLATGHLIWMHEGSVGIRFRQGSGEFLARLDDPAGDYDLLLVPGSGGPRLIARQVYVPW